MESRRNYCHQRKRGAVRCTHLHPASCSAATEKKETETGAAKKRVSPEVSLPRSGPRQPLETRLRVPGEDDVLGRAEDPVADDHLDFKGKPGAYSEESPGVRVGQSLADDHEGVRMKDHQGEEVVDKVFSQSWLTAESIPHSHWVMLVFVNKYGAERSIQSPPLEIFLAFIVFLVKGPH